MVSGGIVVFGSLNTDLLVRVEHLPAPGETVAGADVVRGAGGKGANQALAARRLGARVCLAGMVGSDQFGSELRDGLAAEGVDVSRIGVTMAAPTGMALIVVGPDGDNTITLSPGANAHAAPPPDLAVPLADADALLLQMEVPVGASLAAAEAARASRVPVVLNAAPLPQHPNEEFVELLRRVDVLIVNEMEAAGLAPDVPMPASALRQLGIPEVVVTLGDRGAVAAGPDGVTHVPAFTIQAVDSVGAGDAFCAEFALARLGDGADLVTATRRGCAAGAVAASRPGAQSSLPTRDEVDRLIGINSSQATPTGS